MFKLCLNMHESTGRIRPFLPTSYQLGLVRFRNRSCLRSKDVTSKKM